MTARFCPYPACGALSPPDADYCVECGASLVPAGPARKALGYRCPAHGQHVGVRNGHLAGRCGGCAEEAARAIAQICTTRSTTAVNR